MKINNSKLFLITQSANILLSLNKRKGYYAKLYRDLDCTYHHMSIVLERLKNAELITIGKKGRTKTVEITEKGKIVADNLKKIVELVK